MHRPDAQPEPPARKAVAVVVARGGSRRLPRKAMLPFRGVPLIVHAVNRLRRAECVGRVVVGSDSTEILEAARSAGADIERRDDFHCDESRCSANEMIRDMARRIDEDLILWAHPTNPLVKPTTYDLAVITYLDGLARGFDSLASVSAQKRHAWYQGRPLNHRPYAGTHTPAAGLLPVWYQDGAIFIRPTQDFYSQPRFIGDRPQLFELAGFEGWDIDTHDEYRMALALDQAHA